MKKRILVLGGGFWGLELSTMLSEAFGDGIDVTLIDKGDAFYFGFSKLDVMFGRTTALIRHCSVAMNYVSTIIRKRTLM